MKHSPKHGRTGKASGHPSQKPFEIGRQGAKFLPGDSSSKDHGTETNTWAASVKKEK